MFVPVAHSSESVIKFLDLVQTDVPWKVDNTYLKQHGFTSNNNAELRGVFKSLGFLDTSGSPTKFWHEYRNKEKADTVLQLAIQRTYKEVFIVFPDAYKRETSELVLWFQEKYNYSHITAIRAVRMFKKLCTKANFTNNALDRKHDFNQIKQTKMITDITAALDSFVKDTVGQAVQEGIITKKQGEELFAMHAKQGLWRVTPKD